MNHEGFEKRLSLVKRVLGEHNLKAAEVTPLEYEADCPFPYNNFIYKITLTAPAKPQSFAAARQCTSLPSEEGVSSLVIRLSNPHALGLNQTNRVQTVYDWEPSTQQSDGSRAMGWILMEFLPGVALDRQFAALPEDQKHSLVHQIAEAFSCIQRTPLPNKANLYGGLTIEDDTGIVSGQMTTVSGGPWPTYADFLRAKYASQLKDAQGSPALRGWNENGVRERIDAFLTSGLDSCLESAGCDQSSRVLVHGDLTMNNMLFDPETNRITGVLDFDFASVGHPCQEFFSSFHDVGGNVFGDEVPKGQIWDDALAARDILRPGTIRGMDTLKLLGQLDSLLCPFRLVHPVFLSKMSPGEMEEGRAKAEQALIECLDALKT